MKKANVLVVSSANLKKGFLEDIAAVDSRLQVKDGRKAFAVEIIKTDRQGEGEDNFLRELGISRDKPVPELPEDLDTLLA
ncbi:hypothetical protein ACFLYE_05115, partial [Chloroflexota bacterium]